MRRHAPLVLALHAALAACGPSVDGGQIDGGPDGPDGAVGTAEIGIPCTVEPPSCPSDTPICVVTSEASTDGFCSVPCGMTPPGTGGEQPEPPAGGNDICEDAYGEGSATAACSVVFAEEEGRVPWACGLACGQTPDFDFGTCPSNLACMQGDPTRNGFCLP